MTEDTELKDALKRGSHMFDQVHDTLWDLIIKGDIQPGDRLKDSEWCVKLGISRTPVREAMRKLQQEGVLLPLSAGGYQVKNVSNKDLEELYTCRSALETLATVQASEKLSSEEGRQLLALIDKADAAINKGKIDEAFRINSSFHARIFELAGNSHLNFLGESLSKLVLFYRSALLNRVKKNPALSEQYEERLRAKQQAHREIVAAMLDGKHQEAGELMRTHVLASVKELAM
ncbi:GntR family transcriptional regulator [Cupriavidus oxalaticus]|uniref:GntR family transcriptional regulator n=1 Tax=Cupriavidus oxalaticus TaxID=96344 RepID=UPI004033366A